MAGLEKSGATLTDKAGWNVPQNDLTGDIATEAAVESAVGIFVAPNTTPTGATGATATLAIGDKGVFSASSTITIEFVGGSHVFTFLDTTTAGLNIKVSTVTGAGSLEAAVAIIRDQIIAYLGTLSTDAEKGVSIAAGVDANLAFTQLTLGDETLTGTKTAVINDAGTNDATVTFSGGTNNALAISGTLAAILYMSASNILLSGTGRQSGSVDKRGATAVVQGTGGWTAHINDCTNLEEYKFNFDPASPNFIRNVFNTDATEFADGTGQYNMHYFLGESFEHAVARLDDSNDLFAFTAAIRSGSNGEFTDFQSEATAAKSGWFIGKKPTRKKLFRLPQVRSTTTLI